MDEIITIGDCIKQLESGETATIEVWTYDRKRQKGGEIEALTCKLLTGIEKPEAIQGRALTEFEMSAQRGPDDIDDAHVSRKPNHSEWWTRNVRLMLNGHPTSVIRKIHPPLIKFFNGVKTVP